MIEDGVILRRRNPVTAEIAVSEIRFGGRVVKAPEHIQPKVKQNRSGVWEISLRPFGLVSYGRDLEETIAGFQFMLLNLFRDYAMAADESLDAKARRWKKALLRYFPLPSRVM